MTMAPFIIETPAEYEAARDRVSALLENFKEGTPEQVELDALTEACSAWEAKVDLGSEANGPG
jgi:hypothetical protein